MKTKFFLWIYILLMILITSCEDDSFTMSPSASLDFSTDEISLDTVFCNTPSSLRTFWIYNNNKEGIYCSSIRLERGNQSGFRVNINGEYLGAEVGYQINDVKLYKNDSIQGVVEISPKNQTQSKPQLIEDQLSFLLGNGTTQAITLKAYSWNALTIDSLIVKSDTTIYSSNPLLVKGGIRILHGATLTIMHGTSIYFNSNAGIEVYGTLKLNGKPDAPITLRGSRLDHMFTYLPYDRVSGQWKGIEFRKDSYNNNIEYTDVHGTNDGIVTDSSNIDITKIYIRQSTIHNCKGFGLSLNYSKAIVENCQISNTLNSCVFIKGGDVSFNNCTIAQFYPFDGNRKTAFCFVRPLSNLLCQNTIITGYSDDELNGTIDNNCQFKFENCIIRTPKIRTSDSIFFENIIYEDVEDTLHYGKKLFKTIDANNFIYNFSLDSISQARDKANPLTALPIDRYALYRDERPDIGAFEFKK